LERNLFLADVGEHTSVGDSSSRISQLIFFDSSSGFTVAKPVNKIHIGVFFTVK
jgi:hypothetical protein